MQLLKIDTTHQVTPDILRHIADYIEETSLPVGHSPYPWQILPSSISKILSEIDPLWSIETDADTARDHLDDIKTSAEGLRTLIDIAIASLEKEYPTINIRGLYFDDILKQYDLITPHITNARQAVVDIAVAIDPTYKYITP